jgi:hypothetical protein
MKDLRSVEEREKNLERAFYLRRNTTKLCSCPMCGNPRNVAWDKKDKLTIQERRLEDWRLE